MIASHPMPPFHFDLSIFDLFVSCRNAATLVLIGESLAKEPELLGDFVNSRQISVPGTRPLRSWPCSRGTAAWIARRPAPRLVLFAGEVFPIGPLRRLRQLWPKRVLEPVRPDRDQRLHGPPDTGRHPRRSGRALSDRLGLPPAASTRGR